METTEHELDISTHDLARRSTVPHDPETGLLIISTHDLTRRSTKSNASTILNGVNFNSRSHKEVDFHARRCVLCRICISTHDLTKRSTLSPTLVAIVPDVSTHDLTKRSTLLCIGFFFYSHVSTHDLTKRSTKAYTAALRCVMFQLTTSRRGRRSTTLPRATCIAVSTHDLTKRSTRELSRKRRNMNVSTHDLTKRSTIFFYHFILLIPSFNSRPHEEVDKNRSP